MIRELESSLEHSAMERDRVLMQQQKEYEQRIQALMQQMSNSDARSTPSPGPDRELKYVIKKRRG